ncbi:hypothetical protein [Salinisphaera orenii]|uniref:Uncharacterized protein n=1 Tax=Salinisphaera orenii YIM 95161 TaxID=1051139 RepID=A0A423PRR8_9GAMM|nr:hypothetical protein [Salinisphaera halophila]ROO28273.1 hypothetical protein SAHL_10765 [Salinisphaera halophila YIM 95161]
MNADLINQLAPYVVLAVGLARLANQMLARVAGVTSTTRDDEISSMLGIWIRRVQGVLDTIGLMSDAPAKAAEKKKQRG